MDVNICKVEDKLSKKSLILCVKLKILTITGSRDITVFGHILTTLFNTVDSDSISYGSNISNLPTEMMPVVTF